ncbi:ATP-binding protein [Halospina sp. K52047b]|uniref:sensor histidine kinase n=1 Tax=Halospina sp. K52047b TaxID=2614160 RepID=UPI00124A792E|nr:ATP-binding protein [Halospina sp. K52047b]KAA8980361.1 HAMP domain-containing protein [Halospina sp. K52047b]
MSLTRTLTMAISAVVLLLATSATLWAYLESNHELNEIFDAELAQSTRIVQGLLRHLSETQSPEQLSHTLEQTLQLPTSTMLGIEMEGDYDEILPGGLGHKYEKKIAFEVWNAKGDPMLDTLHAERQEELEAGYDWVDSGGYQWRTFTLKDPATGHWIRTAQRADVRSELSGELAWGNVVPIIAALPLLLLTSLVVIHLSFRPLRNIERPIRHMAPEHLHVLDERHAPREVQGLVEAVNTLLNRLDKAFERERQFSSDAAHELRTPLAALRLNLERLESRHPGEGAGLMSSVDRMSHLVDQILLLSRLDADATSHSTMESTELPSLIRNTVAEIMPIALDNAIDLSFETSTESLNIDCHPSLITTMLRSLLANAIQYSPANTEVILTLEASTDKATVMVTDQGPGIPPGERERAVSRFTRLDQRQGTGAGLGLAIAKRIAELHQGTLSLNSPNADTAGCHVIVTLPLKPSDNASSEAPFQVT